MELWSQRRLALILEDTCFNMQEGNVIVSASDASIQVFSEEAGAGMGTGRS